MRNFFFLFAFFLCVIVFFMASFLLCEGKCYGKSDIFCHKYALSSLRFHSITLKENILLLSHLVLFFGTREQWFVLKNKRDTKRRRRKAITMHTFFVLKSNVSLNFCEYHKKSFSQKFCPFVRIISVVWTFYADRTS
jgi:hypothetical protein